MARHGCWLMGLSGWLLTGCAALPEYAVPKSSMADDLSAAGPARIARPQMREGLPVSLQQPTPTQSGIEQASLANRGTVRVSVRAWVNGRPIFTDELMQEAGAGLGKASRAGKETEFLNERLDDLVDKELMYQDAVKKLEKINPRALDKMRDYVAKQLDKVVMEMRKQNRPEEEIRRFEPTLQRMMERSIIAGEYARSRIMPQVQSLIGLAQIREYYDEHLKEYRSVDKVVWQDIFIPLSPNLPSIDDARRFAEGLIAKCRTPQDFERLMVYNEGDSKLRGGEGLGSRRSYKDASGEWHSEIRPAELEEHLFKLREGEIGPVVAFSTGVHLFRVTKREYEGQLPLDDKLQNQIRKELENKLYSREFRRIARELRQRAVIQVVRE